MEQRELLEREGLFLLEFSDEFFDGIFKENQELEDEVVNIAEHIQSRPDFGKGNVWQCILDEVIKKVLPNGIGNALGLGKDRFVEKEYQELYRLLSGFYSDPLFLSLDVVHEIQYNLLRLDPPEEIDLNEDYEKLKEYETWIDIGNKKYGEDKELPEDFEEDVRRLRNKYGDHHLPSVSMFYQPEHYKIPVDSVFIELNLSYMGNEKFQDYLYHAGKRGVYFDTLMDLVEKLNETEFSMHYIWEKLTNFNAICILGKFFWHINGNRYKSNITEKEQIAFWEKFVKETAHPFFQILDMPNYLTRLLCLKQILGYIEKQSPYMIGNLWRQFNLYLAEINSQYKKIQKIVLMFSVLVKWKMDIKKDQKREDWFRDLEDEYPMPLYEKLYTSADVPCNMIRGVHTLDIKAASLKRKEYRLILNEFLSKSESIQQLYNTKNFQLLSEIEMKTKYLSILEESGYWRCNQDGNWGQRLKEAGFIPLDKVLLDNLNRDEGKYIDTSIGKIDRTWSVGDDVEPAPQLKNYGGEIEYRLEQIITPHLLSEFKDILFENTLEIKSNKIMKKYINNLLYYFYI